MTYLNVVVGVCFLILVFFVLNKLFGRKLQLIDTFAQGKYLRVVYHWNKNMSHEKADKLDTKVRQIVAKKIGIAAVLAGLRCEKAANHGIRPAWYLGENTIPFSVIEAGFDNSENTCWATIGPVATINVATL